MKWDGKLVTEAKDVSPSVNGGASARYILRPQFDSKNVQAREVRECLNRTFKEGGWCVCLDETFYVYSYLKVKDELDRNMTQGRSEGVTMVCGMQRPVAITRMVLAQSTHVIAFQQDGRDALELSKAIGIGKDVQLRLTRLSEHEFMWYHVPSQKYWVGRVQDLESEGGPKFTGTPALKMSSSTASAPSSSSTLSASRAE